VGGGAKAWHLLIRLCPAIIERNNATKHFIVTGLDDIDVLNRGNSYQKGARFCLSPKDRKMRVLVLRYEGQPKESFGYVFSPLVAGSPLFSVELSVPATEMTLPKICHWINKYDAMAYLVFLFKSVDFTF
jgi:hypothetical protein